LKKKEIKASRTHSLVGKYADRAKLQMMTVETELLILLYLYLLAFNFNFYFLCL